MLQLQVDSDDSVVEQDEGNYVRSEKLTLEAEPEEDDGGLIPAPGLLAAAAVLLCAARRRR